MPQSAQKPIPNETEMTQEYVVGGRGFYASEVLSNANVDAFFPNFNGESQRRMRYDSEIESSVEFLIDSVFADGIAPVSPITDEDADDYGQAKEIADFIAEAVKNPARSCEAVMREIFRGAFYGGVKVGEIVLRITETGETHLDRINPKPNESTAFVSDRFWNVLGLVGANENGVLSTSINPDSDEIIRREKFVVLNFELENNDPRGVAKIRAAFQAWCEKQETRPQYKEWRRTSAIPKKFGTTAPNAKDVDVRDANGNKAFNSDGSPKTMSAQKVLMTALEGFANNSTVTAPNGTTVEQLEVQGTGIQFLNGFKFFNSEIRKAILGDSVTTGQDDKGVKAAKDVAMNVVELRVKSFKNAVAECVERDLYRLLTIINFGADKAHLSPLCSLGDTERRDWNETASSLKEIGYQMAPEHFREGDQMLGFKPRTVTENTEDQRNPGGLAGENNSEQDSESEENE